MALLKPAIMLDKITEIDAAFLHRHQIRALMLDVDNIGTTAADMPIDKLFKG